MKQPPIDKIICGDNVTVMSEWEDESIDMFLTSPPYDSLRTYNGFEWDFDLLADQLWRVIKPGGVGVWVVADATVNGSETGTSFRQALGFMERGFSLETMIYEQTGTGAKGSNNFYWQSFEFMFLLIKGSAPKTVNLIKDRRNKARGTVTAGERLRTNGNKKETRRRVVPEYSNRTNIWRITPDRLDCHPAPFPEALAHDHILSWSNPGDIILDPFMGSGTTAKMAHLTDRHYIGIDISESYVELAKRRVAAVKQQPKLFTWDLQPAL